MIEGEMKRLAHPLLQLVLFGAVFLHRLPGLQGRQFCRRPMLIGRADVENVVTALAHEPAVYVSRQHGADQVAQVLDAVDVRQRGGDENASHCGPC